MSEPDDRIDLSVKDALAALDVQHQHYDDGEEKWERDTVHCFLPTYPGPGQLVLIGADWDLAQVRELFEQDPNGPEVSGPGGLSMHHGVGVRATKGDPKSVEKFFATRKDWVPPTVSTRERKP
jgi:hypothetical protein